MKGQWLRTGTRGQDGELGTAGRFGKCWGRFNIPLDLKQEYYARAYHED